ncbi:TIGR04282 family arsenosugar biosynthesis glycosyltransferase [Flavobacteriaceae bacterium S0825]|uniref:TIGR04282 family arsenosugar biosynthesis glycosyltransferase n=1 Tax=Gaetbulibacter sp. S0825 TaxID=2720084 RepID=UPI0014312289|nr:TIGR04282 family arsenosugar biosynthesis glycosyltransferase [Gaetbulibacter sp. S0825]MCK0107770.1 TIGR04282 family arsenosugar biosynthesis glycosyltransferase [Flavobacteriaceae bacterium S0825]NIX63406.1 glycosyltransferase [Gaetbulibacter sp. S0825]
MSKTLLIIFVKNIKLGKVKTRLAKTVGNENAFKVYKALVKVTEKATSKINVDKRIYFSDNIVDEKWPNDYKTIQKGTDLGERMSNAFQDGFDDGYEKIALIGSDLPNISTKIIQDGFNELQNNDVVFGPAEDGGYYLIGMSKFHNCIFENKAWSTSVLLEETLAELKQKKIEVSLIETLNDIDTFEDLQEYPKFLKLISI